MPRFFASLLVATLASACMVQPAAPAAAPAPYAGQPYAAQPAAAPGAPGAQVAPGAPVASANGRRVRFNGADLDERGWQTVAQLEATYQTRLPDGDYWYDARSGASGPWGGPVVAVIPAGLPLPGTLAANASGGGDGRLTGVFVNGRELHPKDVLGLRTFMQVLPGRFWVDAQGNGGYEGGPAIFNLYALAQQAQRSRGMTDKKDANGRVWAGGGASGADWKSDGGSVSNSCSYDPSDGAGVMCDSHRTRD